MMTAGTISVHVVKRILCVIILAVFIFAYTLYMLPSNFVKTDQDDIKVSVLRMANLTLKTKDLKYILLWTDPKDPPFDLLRPKRSAFVQNKCKFTNCYVTSDKNFFENLTDFDAVIFNQKNVKKFKDDLPKTRSPRQKYIFASTESSHYYPIPCHTVFNGYYNWTWTYKLGSDIQWRYITIYDLEGNVVGPKFEMEWPKHMEPLNLTMQDRFNTKHITAGWFVSNCRTRSQRENFISNLAKPMLKYNLTLETVGRCGKKVCLKRVSSCHKMIEHDYFFYFAFENSFSEDYVTEKLLNALNNFAVPVVFGGADYSRFLAPGSYLDAQKLGAEGLAEKMYEIVNNKTMYYDYHRWRNHFVYKDTMAEAVCDLCEALNNQDRFQKKSVHDDITKWWNDHQKNRSCL